MLVHFHIPFERLGISFAFVFNANMIEVVIKKQVGADSLQAAPYHSNDNSLKMLLPMHATALMALNIYITKPMAVI